MTITFGESGHVKFWIEGTCLSRGAYWVPGGIEQVVLIPGWKCFIPKGAVEDNDISVPEHREATTVGRGNGTFDSTYLSLLKLHSLSTGTASPTQVVETRCRHTTWFQRECFIWNMRSSLLSERVPIPFLILAESYFSQKAVRCFRGSLVLQLSESMVSITWARSVRCTDMSDVWFTHLVQKKGIIIIFFNSSSIDESRGH